MFGRREKQERRDRAIAAIGLIGDHLCLDSNSPETSLELVSNNSELQKNLREILRCRLAAEYDFSGSEPNRVSSPKYTIDRIPVPTEILDNVIRYLLGEQCEDSEFVGSLFACWDDIDIPYSFYEPVVYGGENLVIDGKYRITGWSGNAMVVYAEDINSAQKVVLNVRGEAYMAQYPSDIVDWGLDHVVKFIEKKNTYMVMEFVEGQTVELLLRSPVQLTDVQRLLMAKQAAMGLLSIHAREVSHCDTHTGNIIVSFSEQGRPLITWIDFEPWHGHNDASGFRYVVKDLLGEGHRVTSSMDEGLADDSLNQTQVLENVLQEIDETLVERLNQIHGQTIQTGQLSPAPQQIVNLQRR